MLAEQLTITMVAHNLVSLHYPFIEAMYALKPLGCHFLVGDCESTDDTVGVLQEVGKYLPVDVVKLRWRTETGGTAIGIATQELLNLSPTEYSYQLQACEVLCDDGVAAVQEWFARQPTTMAFWFRHFWGDFRFDGAIGGRAYGKTWRVLNKSQVMDKGDGYVPADPPGDSPTQGTIHRYAYCFENQARAKARNHYKLYHGDAQHPDVRMESIEWCRRNSNYDGPHPACVQHLIDKRNYDIEFSLDWFRRQF